MTGVCGQLPNFLLYNCRKLQPGYKSSSDTAAAEARKLTKTCTMIDAQIFLWKAYTRPSPSPSVNRYGKTGKATWAIAKTPAAIIRAKDGVNLRLNAFSITPLKTISSHTGTSTIIATSSTMVPGSDTSSAAVSSENSDGLTLTAAANTTCTRSALSKTRGACQVTWSIRQDKGLNPRDDHERWVRFIHHHISKTVAIDIPPIVKARPSNTADLLRCTISAVVANIPRNPSVTRAGMRHRIANIFVPFFIEYFYNSTRRRTIGEDKKTHY